MRFTTIQEAWNATVAQGGFIYHNPSLSSDSLPFQVVSVAFDGKLNCEPARGFQAVTPEQIDWYMAARTI